MRELSPENLNKSAYGLIAHDWMLITAGNEERGYNTMTASWGHLGSLWGKPTSLIYVRPQRYTKEFVDREEFYTLSFFDETYRKALVHLGTASGRDGDKVSVAGLTPVFNGDVTYFAEAKLVLVCRKLYQAPVREKYFLDKSLMNAVYPERDFHDLYVGEIVKILEKE